MKKLLFSTLLFCFVSFISCKKDKSNMQVDYCKVLNDTTGKSIFQYPAYPNEVWKAMPYLEKIENVQLPAEYMNALTNEQLFYNCLFWKFNGNILLFNTLQAGYLSVYRDFNGLTELCRRQDVEKLLLNNLLEIFPSAMAIEGECVFKILMVEMICAQSNIINRYDENDTFIILKKWISIFDEITISKNWGYNDYSPAIRALSNILIKVNYLEFKPFSESKKFQIYIEGRMEIDYEIISNVIDCSKNYYQSIKQK